MEIVLKLLLVGSTAFGGVWFSIAGLNWNIERIALALAFVPIVMLYAFQRRRVGNVYPAFAAGGLFYVWAVWLLVPLLLSSNPTAHVTGYMVSVQPVIAYFVFSLGAKNDKAVANIVEGLLWYLAAGGCLSYVIWSFDAPQWLNGAVDPMNRVMLTLMEPNIYGAAVGYFFILWLPQFKGTIQSWVLCGLSAAAIILSFSKGPYIGALIGALIYLHLAGHFKPFQTRVKIAILLAAVCLVVIGLWDVGIDLYTQHLARQDSIVVRLIQLQVAWNKILEHPLIGNGPLDFGVTAWIVPTLIGSHSMRDAWIWQMFVAILHDSGTIGLLIYLTFLAGLIRHGLSLASTRRSGQHAAYLAGFMCLLIASQVTTTHLTVLFGIAAGLVGASRGNFAVQSRRGSPNSKFGRERVPSRPHSRVVAQVGAHYPETPRSPPRAP